MKIIAISLLAVIAFTFFFTVPVDAQGASTPNVVVTAHEQDEVKLISIAPIIGPSRSKFALVKTKIRFGDVEFSCPTTSYSEVEMSRDEWLMKLQQNKQFAMDFYTRQLGGFTGLYYEVVLLTAGEYTRFTQAL